MRNIIEVKNLKKIYGEGTNKTVALSNVDLVVKEAEFLSIMGASGSGKTTLLQIIGGLDEPSSGNFLLHGIENKDIFKEPNCTDYRRQNIGFVFQFFNLLSPLTVKENVELPLILSGTYSYNEINDLSKEYLSFVGLFEKRNSRPFELSGGQQQRVAIARALITKPKIIIADEPTGNLDTNTSKEIIELFISLKEKYNQSIVLVTHDPNVAARADRILFLKDGRIIMEKAMEEGLTQKEKVQSIYSVMSEVGDLV